MALGGSTNATLHLLAIAHNVDLSPRNFNTTKNVCLTWPTETIWSVSLNLYESRWCASRIYEIRQMVSLHGDRITCTGKTVAENLADFADLTRQKVIMPRVKTCRRSLIILNETLADGAVAKVSGVVRRHVGPAKVFDSEGKMLSGCLTGEIVDDVVVVRFWD